jgi:16S rRNA (guanine527-N7)-methyltransferase
MEIIKKYFSGLSSIQTEQFAALDPLYQEWNARINVISRKDIDQLYERHILHSLAIAKVVQFSPGTRILDVGTGGGFPGIPLAVLFPETEFLLVDSVAKKIKVVEEVANVIGLRNVKAVQQRAETVNSRFDFIVSRAVTAFPDFVSLVGSKISARQRNSIHNGVLYLKGGEFEEELKPFGNRAKVYALRSFFEEEFFETKKLIHLSC